ncbi:MAG: hypothetical protein KatS3mg015_2225 [Fimbriimonadales bacterium]|nr:MAG: hypothetical protein KatS3mg015_2225 [Fimbriimonadales bacterium]
MRLPIVAVTALLAVAAFSQRSRELPAVRLDTPPVVDGVVQEQEWAAAARSEGFVDRFTETVPAGFNTLVYAAYTDEGAYFAIVAFDPDPSQIRATEYRREANLGADDRLSVILNPFGTLVDEDENRFTVNPRGATRAEFAGGRAAKREWQGEWTAKARITDTGWEAEFFIPWHILRLPGAGTRTMTINFARSIPRAQLDLQWSSLGPERREEYIGRWVGVDLPAIAQPIVLQLLPFSIFKAEEDRNRPSIHAGVDGRVQLTSSLTGLLTVNPDFENIEQSVVGIDFSQFERLGDETRPFFTEGEEFFRFGGRSVRMFAPQRIGQIDAGIKTFGKMTSDLSAGALIVERFGKQTGVVLQMQQSWGSTSELTVGYVFDETETLDNHSVGLDGRYRLAQPWTINTRFGMTDDSDLGTGYRYDASLSYNSGPITLGGGWQRIDANFLPRLGFAPRRGFEGAEFFGFYRREYQTGSIARFEGNVFVNSRDDVETGRLYERSISAGSEVSFRRGPEIEIRHDNNTFSDLADLRTSVQIRYPSDDPIRNFSAEYVLGEIGGEQYREIRGSVRWRFEWGLSVAGSLQFVKLGADDDSQHVFNITYELSEFQSISARAILRDNDVNWYAAYRLSGDFGPEYFVIVGDPNSRTFTERLAFKVILPFDLVLGSRS